MDYLKIMSIAASRLEQAWYGLFNNLRKGSAMPVERYVARLVDYLVEAFLQRDIKQLIYYLVAELFIDAARVVAVAQLPPDLFLPGFLITGHGAFRKVVLGESGFQRIGSQLSANHAVVHAAPRGRLYLACCIPCQNYAFAICFAQWFQRDAPVHNIRFR
jgi:hypothetical protein